MNVEFMNVNRSMLLPPLAIILSWTAALSMAAGAAAKPFLDIAADSPSRETLRRIQTRSAGLFPSQAFPQGEPGMRKYLESARLTGADSAFLWAYLPGYRREMVQWADTGRGHTLFVSPALELAAYGSTLSDSASTGGLIGVGGGLYGKFMPRLSFYSRGMIFTEMTDKAQFAHQFSPEFGETYTVEKGAGDSLLKNRTYNRFESYVIADLPFVVLKAGRDRVHTGPGYFSSLLATRDTPPYYMVEARIDFARWLEVDNYLLRMTDTDHGIRKFANLHRFEFKPTPALRIAFQDIVIYQDRDPDWRYILPLTPLTFTEADMGGPDNSAMAFDFIYGGFRNLSFWGELFIDDLMSPSSFFNEFWENRWAGLAGFQIVAPVQGLDADLVVEYSQVEPWTYNGRKPQTSFKHFNVPSASRLGPDSRTWDAQLSYRPRTWLEIRQRLDFSDKGLGRSGTLGTIHDDGIDGLTKSFLEGEVASRRVWTQEVGFLFRQYLHARAAWSRDFGDADDDRIAAELELVW